MQKQGGVTLIGMPGCGKSTLGVLLAKALCLDFVDTDVLIQLRHHNSLQQLIDAHGYLRLREWEAQVLLELDARTKVVATGGSAVYSHEAMEQLRQGSQTLYLDVPLPILQRRLGNFGQRGVAAPRGSSLADIFAQRTPLYQRYADITVSCDDQSPQVLLAKLIQALER